MDNFQHKLIEEGNRIYSPLVESMKIWAIQLVQGSKDVIGPISPICVTAAHLPQRVAILCVRKPKV